MKNMSAVDLYLLLLVLGHRLDTAGSRLDALLKKLNARCDHSKFQNSKDMTISFAAHCRWTAVSVSRFIEMSLYPVYISCRKY
jgi:hypothetical protein